MKINIWKIKNYRKDSDHRNYTGEFRGDAHSICNLKYNLPKKIPIVSQNGCNYDYHFIKKELVEELKKLLNHLVENTDNT